MTPAEALIAAGRAFPGAHVFDGLPDVPESDQPHPYLAVMAQQHAEYQGYLCQQGHQDWACRFALLQHELGTAFNFREICAESWKWEKDYPLEQVGKSMFDSWRQSAGHWSVASVPHRWFGAGMALGRNGIWYATVIVGD